MNERKKMASFNLSFEISNHNPNHQKSHLKYFGKTTYWGWCNISMDFSVYCSFLPFSSVVNQ